MLGLPRAVAVSRLEQSRGDFEATVALCQRTFGDAQPLALPLMSGGSITGTADLLRRTVRDHTGDEPQQREPDAEEAALIEEHRGTLIESVIEESEDETLLERYLGGEDVDLEGVAADLRAAIATARFFPVLPTHAPSGVGVDSLLELIERAFPSPVEARIPAVYTPVGGDFGAVACDPEGPLVAEVVRTTTDPYVGRLSLVRVFSGTLRPDEPVHVSGHLSQFVGRELEGHGDHDSDDERVGPLSAPVVDEMRAKPFAIAGDVVQVSKISQAETSDTLSGKDKPALVEPWYLPEPLLPVAIHAKSKGDEDKLGTALQRIVAEDVTMRLEHNAETHQVVLWAMGPSHVDQLLDERCRTRYHVEVEVEPLRTSLRETFVGPVEVQGRLVKQSGGHGQYAVCRLRGRAPERGPGSSSSTRWWAAPFPASSSPRWRRAREPSSRRACCAGYPGRGRADHPRGRQGPLGRLLRHGVPDGGCPGAARGRQRVHGLAARAHRRGRHHGRDDRWARCSPTCGAGAARCTAPSLRTWRGTP